MDAKPTHHPAPADLTPRPVRAAGSVRQDGPAANLLPLVERRRIELPTSRVRCQRSPTFPDGAIRNLAQVGHVSLRFAVPGHHARPFVAELVGHLPVLSAWQLEQAGETRMRQGKRLRVFPQVVHVMPAVRKGIANGENRTGRTGVPLGDEVRHAEESHD